MSQHDIPAAPPDDAFARVFASMDELDLPVPTDDEPGVIWEVAPGQDAMKPAIVAALKTVFDPEIPESIYDLGLVYRVIVDDQAHVTVDFTLTSPNCPEAEALPGAIERALLGLAPIPDDGLELRLVWNPPWSMERMPWSVRLAMNLI